MQVVVGEAGVDILVRHCRFPRWIIRLTVAFPFIDGWQQFLKLVAAERNGEKIAIAIKSFLGSSAIKEFHLALGHLIEPRSGCDPP
ncbi:MAG: XisH family protein [Scytolyngbya sp. HA4215-MV1]|nr:XisH family protein [Scytolyngbya sp. HA4215-MV1]